MTQLEQNIASVRRRIAAACAAAGRDPAAIRLVAVSKTFPAAAVREAALAGQVEFGESYVQEATPKLEALAGLPLTWHFIGPIQSNKTRGIAGYFDWAHAVDRLRIAERLSEQRPASRGALQVCVQVNVSGEASKSGCAPDQTLALCRAVAALPGLRLRGLMAIPAPGAGRAPFRELRRLFEELLAAGLDVDTLSAGMSDDLEDAIAEGSTLVRVGSAIFGRREA